MYVGVDIVENKRIESLMNRKGELFLRKVFTEEERNYIASKNNRVETIAGIFAAKEAVGKSLKTGIGKIGWKNIEIVHSKEGAPIIRIDKKKLLEIKIEKKLNFDLSISHEKEYTVAFVIRF